MAQEVKNPPAVQEPQEMWVRSLGWEDPLKKKMATHSRTIAWKIPWTEAPGRLQSMGSQRVRRNGATSLSHVVYYYLAECISPSGLGWSL